MACFLLGIDLVSAYRRNSFCINRKDGSVESVCSIMPIFSAWKCRDWQ